MASLQSWMTSRQSPNGPTSPPKPYAIPYQRPSSTSPSKQAGHTRTDIQHPMYKASTGDGHSPSYHDYSIQDGGITPTATTYLPTTSTTSVSNDYIESLYTPKKSIDTYDHSAWFAHTSLGTLGAAEDLGLLSATGNTSTFVPQQPPSVFSMDGKSALSAASSKSDLKSQKASFHTFILWQVRNATPWHAMA